MSEPNWLDRAVGYLVPQYGLKRMRARVATEMLARHYEAASIGRRTQGWNKAAGDANAVVSGGLSQLRNVARDLVRNNPHAESALSTIADHAIGWGIVGKPLKGDVRAKQAWDEWADTTACDSDGRTDFYGLQKLAFRTVVESGEVLIRRRLRFPEDGLPLPLQLQVLEPDYIDTAKTGIVLPNGGRIIHGIEFDPLGRRVAYWLFPEHPGAAMTTFTGGGNLGLASVRMRAENFLHIYRQTRPGQVRGASWFAPVLLRFKDFDEYEDAQLMKQKIAACLAVITSDVDGTAPPLGTADTTQTPQWDMLEPGVIANVPPGRTIEVVRPPQVGDYGVFCEITLRAIATGIGVTYEDLTGDYTDLPFSAARMSRMRHWARVEDWRWGTIIPQMCNPIWNWAMQAAVIERKVSDIPVAKWTAPPMPMIDPGQEGLAYQRNIRTGIATLSESIRERGYDPDEMLAEMAEDYKKLDKLKLVLDSDPRKTTQAGNPVAAIGASQAPKPAQDMSKEMPEPEDNKPNGAAKEAMA